MVIPIVSALADRAGRPDELVASGPVINMRFRHGQRALSLRAGKAFHLLVKSAGARLVEDRKHTLPLAELWRVAHLSQADLVETVAELQSTVIEITVVESAGIGRPPRRTVVSGPLLDHVERDLDEGGNLVFRFSETTRRVMSLSDHWAVLSRRVVLSFEGRYGLRLYELVALRAGLTHRTNEVFELDDLRRRLGVPEGRLTAWADFRRKVLQAAVDEINHLSGFSVSFAAVKRGRAVAAVKLIWRAKDAVGRAAAQRELNGSRVGRRARRTGTVEIVAMPAGEGAASVEKHEPLPADTAPNRSGFAAGPPPSADNTGQAVDAPSATAPRSGQALPFPASGTIAFGRWADLVRQHAPAPTPDVDRVANAFRDWASHAGLPLGGATVEKAFVTFCQGFRSRR